MTRSYFIHDARFLLEYMSGVYVCIEKMVPSRSPSSQAIPRGTNEHLTSDL